MWSDSGRRGEDGAQLGRQMLWEGRERCPQPCVGAQQEMERWTISEPEGQVPEAWQKALGALLQGGYFLGGRRGGVWAQPWCYVGTPTSAHRCFGSCLVSKVLWSLTAVGLVLAMFTVIFLVTCPAHRDAASTGAGKIIEGASGALYTWRVREV